MPYLVRLCHQLECLLRFLKLQQHQQLHKQTKQQHYQKLFQQAKAMEKEQIVDAHLTGLIHPLEIEATKQAEQYYTETYKGGEL